MQFGDGYYSVTTPNSSHSTPLAGKYQQTEPHTSKTCGTGLGNAAVKTQQQPKNKKTASNNIQDKVAVTHS
jgi:hypothetical protein